MSRKYLGRTLLVLWLLVVVALPVYGQEKVKISIMYIWTDTRIPLLEEAIARFEERFPHIEVEHILVASNELKEKRVCQLNCVNSRIPRSTS